MMKGWLVSVPGARRVRTLNKHPFYMYIQYSDLFPDWQVANDSAKPKVFINSNNSSVDCKKLQIEICNRK